MTFFRKIDEEKPRESRKWKLWNEVRGRVQRLKVLLEEAKQEQRHRRSHHSTSRESHNHSSSSHHHSHHHYHTSH